MVDESLIFLGVPLWDWISETVRKIGSDDSSQAWNRAWVESYYKSGGAFSSSAEKNCPMKAAYTLFFLGRFVGVDRPILDWTLKQVQTKLSKNGVYAIISLDLLKKDPTITKRSLWEEVRNMYRNQLDEEPAYNEAGAVSIAFKLFHAGKIQYPE